MSARQLPLFVPAILLLAGLAAAQPVEVIVDMNPAAPGIQHYLYIPGANPRLPDSNSVVRTRAEVWIRDPLGTRTFYTIGFLGGIDRGIGFGHTPDKSHGTVLSIDPAGTHPVNPGNTAYLENEPLSQSVFAGPEVGYIEVGATAPAVIPANPAAPAFAVDIVIGQGYPHDHFDFYLVDVVTIWGNGTRGAFSTQQPMSSFDTGGDCVPDATRTLFGVDPDPAQPVPPAAFYVDYIDGPPATGPAWLEVVPLGDCNCDYAFNFLDINPFVLALSDPPAYAESNPHCSILTADCNQDGVVNFDDINAFVELIWPS